ncbi:MAG TPA: glycosyltransferase family A protein [Planctomicrobium sp.]|nr:glycosyltransferase family A protein [Planctomicrobium sp.]
MPVPKISAVIPAYNAEATIARTLESVLAQTVQPHEIIVVDDGSRDQTARIVQTFGPHVKLIQQTNSGPSAARNHGVRVATGDWIAFLDSDDAWLPEKLELQIKTLNSDVALSHTYTLQDLSRCSESLNFDRLWDSNYIGTSTVIVKKSVFNNVGGFIEDRKFIGAEDYNLWLRIAARGEKIVTVRRELTDYTPAENSLSQQIEKVIKAELLNMESLARDLNLPLEKVTTKRAALLEEYAAALFWLRDLPLARQYYRELLNDRPSARAFGYWIATYIPVNVLNIPRRLSRKRVATTPSKTSAQLAGSR